MTRLTIAADPRTVNAETAALQIAATSFVLNMVKSVFTASVSPKDAKAPIKGIVNSSSLPSSAVNAPVALLSLIRPRALIAEERVSKSSDLS